MWLVGVCQIKGSQGPRNGRAIEAAKHLCTSLASTSQRCTSLPLLCCLVGVCCDSRKEGDGHKEGSSIYIRPDGTLAKMRDGIVELLHETWRALEA